MVNRNVPRFARVVVLVDARKELKNGERMKFHILSNTGIRHGECSNHE